MEAIPSGSGFSLSQFLSPFLRCWLPPRGGRNGCGSPPCLISWGPRAVGKSLAQHSQQESPRLSLPIPEPIHPCGQRNGKPRGSQAWTASRPWSQGWVRSTHTPDLRGKGNGCAEGRQAWLIPKRQLGSRPPSMALCPVEDMDELASVIPGNRRSYNRAAKPG